MIDGITRGQQSFYHQQREASEAVNEMETLSKTKVEMIITEVFWKMVRDDINEFYKSTIDKLEAYKQEIHDIIPKIAKPKCV